MPAPQSTNEKPADCVFADGGGADAPGSCVCTVKIRFEFGKKMPRINCAMFPSGGYARVCAVAALASAGFEGHPIAFNASSVDASSVAPARKPPVLSMCATRSTDCAAVRSPGLSAGIVLRILVTSVDSGSVRQLLTNASPTRGGACPPLNVLP